MLANENQEVVMMLGCLICESHFGQQVPAGPALSGGACWSTAQSRPFASCAFACEVGTQNSVLAIHRRVADKPVISFWFIQAGGKAQVKVASIGSPQSVQPLSQHLLLKLA